MDWQIERQWRLHLPEGAQRIVSTSELASFRAVGLLGAAGIGKSWELARLVEIESAHNGHVVRCDLGQKVAGGLNLRHHLDNIAKRADVIYLDSLDEAMVPLRTVVASLEDWIDELPDEQPNLRIACRSAAWPATTLINAMHRAYGEDGICIAELLPIDRDQIVVAAKSCGLDPSAFLSAVDDAGAFVLARQPLTLQLLMGEFKAANALPSGRGELFERSIHRLASERQERRERGTGLSIESNIIVEGAEQLAVYCLLSGRESVTLTDDVDGPHCISYLELERLDMPGRPLGSQLLSEISRCGLFQSDGPGRFRFLHRQLAEFMAGRRLATLPIHQSRSLLSRDTGWHHGVAAPLREIAVAAALYSSDIAKWVASADPEVIGRSDVADEELRRHAFDELQMRFRRSQLTDAQIARDEVSLQGLRYDGVQDDLRSILCERGEGLDDVHALAIELTEKWKLKELSTQLAEIVLDTALPDQTRKDAGYALVAMGTEEQKARLKPLIDGSEGDPYDDLRGLALRCTWPQHITVQELLSALAPPKKKNFHGAYEGFLSELQQRGFDSADDLVAGLSWARTVASEMGWLDGRQRLAGRIAFRALDEVHRPDVRAALTDLMMQRGRRHFQPFFVPKPEKNWENDHVFIENRFGKSVDLRRHLIDELAIGDRDPRDVAFALMRVPGFCCLEDFPWLIERGLDESRGGREVYAAVAAHLPWQTDRECIDRWLSVFDHAPFPRYFGTQLSIELSSDDERKAREWHEASRPRVEGPPSQLKPPPAERVAMMLARCEQDCRWFSRLCRELTLEDTSKHYGFERFLVYTPGWANARDETRQRIVTAAKNLLVECDELAAASREAESNSILTDGAAHAIFLLLSEDRAWLEGRPDCWWSTWRWYALREMHLHLNNEPSEPKAILFKMLYEKATVEVRSEIFALIESGSTSLLNDMFELMDPIADTDLDNLLCERLRDNSHVNPDALPILLRLCLRRAPERAIAIAISMARQSVEDGNQDQAAAFILGLLLEQPVRAWADATSLLNGNIRLARDVLGRFAHTEQSHHRLPGLSDYQLGDLMHLLFDAFPPKDDPEHEGAYSVSPIDSAVELRNRLISHLGDLGSPKAVDSLRELETRHGTTYPWLRRPRSRAELRLGMSRWTPLTLPAIAKVLFSHDLRLIRSVDDLIESVEEAVRGYEDRLQRVTPPMCEELWNTGSEPNPKTEEWVSDKVCHAIREYHERYAVTVAREAQLRRRVVKGFEGAAGQVTDVLVQVPACGTMSGESIVLIIEVKRSCNPDVKKAMRSQLVDRYLVQNGYTHGVYVMAYMDAPGLRNSLRPRWALLEDAARELGEHAEGINADSELSVNVRAIVLDARLA